MQSGQRTPSEAGDPDSLSELRAAVQAGLPTAIADLARLVRIPSVSWAAFDPARVQESADAVAALISGLGVFETVNVHRAAQAQSGAQGQPAVLATRAARNGRPSILLYAHHDVQPPGDPDDWESPAFEPTVRGDRLFGRGAADDKAGIMTHVAAIRALVDVSGPDFDLGLAVFIEGEEEFGSRSFANFLADHEAELAADVIVVADSTNWTVDTPALTVGLRGNVTFRLTVSTLDHASHSGMFGGAVPDAMLAMVLLLASLYRDDGSVAVDGLTQRDVPVPDYSEADLRRDAGLLDGVSSIGSGNILGRIWSKPAITITGIDAPSVANASNTLAPSISVRMSVRVAPGQSASAAADAVESHLRRHTPFGALVDIADLDTGEPFLVDTSGWAVADTKKSMTDAWGVEPIEMGVGGSIPFIADLVTRFPDAQILVTGVEDPDSRAHSPNESLHLGVFHRAVLTEALLLWRANERDATGRGREQSRRSDA